MRCQSFDGPERIRHRVSLYRVGLQPWQRVVTNRVSGTVDNPHTVSPSALRVLASSLAMYGGSGWASRGYAPESQAAESQLVDSAGQQVVRWGTAAPGTGLGATAYATRSGARPAGMAPPSGARRVRACSAWAQRGARLPTILQALTPRPLHSAKPLHRAVAAVYAQRWRRGAEHVEPTADAGERIPSSQPKPDLSAVAGAPGAKLGGPRRAGRPPLCGLGARPRLACGAVGRLACDAK